MILAKNIKFEYADNVLPNPNREQAMDNLINLWLGEFADKINKQSGTVEVYFQDDLNQRISFNGMDDDLQAILYQQLKKFQPPHTRRPDSPGM